MGASGRGYVQGAGVGGRGGSFVRAWVCGCVRGCVGVCESVREVRGCGSAGVRACVCLCLCVCGFVLVLVFVSLRVPFVLLGLKENQQEPHISGPSSVTSWQFVIFCRLKVKLALDPKKAKGPFKAS